MGLAEVRKRLEAAAARSIPLDIVVTETGATTPGVLVAVMLADLATLHADLLLMGGVVEAAREVFNHDRSIEWPYGDLLKEALEAFEAGS